MPPEKKRRKPMFKAPGASYAGALEPLTDDERAVAQSLTADVKRLAGAIGERNLDHFAKLVEAAAFIEAEFKQAGYQTARQSFDTRGRGCDNIEAELAGAALAGEIVIVGAHYDTNPGTPGADDNGSGIAGLLSLARRLAADKPARTVRFVAFANEEAPYFQTPQMGSLVYARRSKERGERITAMLSLETIGYYSDQPNSQHYPLIVSLMYPSTGNFIGFIGNMESQPLVEQATTAFRRAAKFPSEGAALPDAIDGVGWSDHWSFWQQGYPALMVTDTAPFRNPNYHQATDTPDTLDYERTARVVVGLEAVVRELAKP